MKSILLFIMGICCSIWVRSMTVYYVNSAVNGSGGTSWSDAKRNLQDAITLAQSGDQIWVAAGTYYGNSATGFGLVLKDGVAIYGGFAGNELALNDRDPATHISIIVGDYADAAIQGTDIGTAGLTVLDGFTITNSSSAASHRGRAIYLNNVSSGVKIANCIIKGFYPMPDPDPKKGYGAGLYMENSSPVITNCSFSENKAAGDYGGAVYVKGGTPEFINCSFLNNQSARYGGGASNIACQAIYSHCIFKGNQTASLQTDFGGAVSFDQPVAVDQLEGSVLDNCLFTGNTSGSGGAAIKCSQAGLSILNCTITGNPAGNEIGGGAIVYANTNGTKLSIANSIIWNNPSTHGDPSLSLLEIRDVSISDPSATPAVTQSIIKYGQFNSYDVDPVFVDATGGDFHLAAGSPGIDGGDNSLLDAALDGTDLSGNHRVINGTVDLGAYETISNIITNNGDNSFEGFNGALDITANVYDNDLTNTYKWKMVITGPAVNEELEVGPEDLAAYSGIMSTLHIVLDDTHFQVPDLSVMPILLNIITGQNTWNDFNGDVLITRVVYPGQIQEDSVESNSELITFASTLPVTVKDFTGKLQGSHATIQWHTGLETGLDHFELEKSPDGKTFRKEIIINPQGSNSSYKVEVMQAEAKAFYRLKLIHRDGTDAYYERLVALTAKSDAGISIYPNPATTEFNVRVDKAGILYLYDGTGRLVRTINVKEGLNKVNISRLSAGVYYGQINGGDRFKILKQ